MLSGRHLAKRGKQQEKPRDWEQGNNRQHMPSPSQASCLPGSTVSSPIPQIVKLRLTKVIPRVVFRAWALWSDQAYSPAWSSPSCT